MHSMGLAGRQRRRPPHEQGSDVSLFQGWNENPASTHLELAKIAQQLGALSVAAGLTPFEPTDADLAALAKSLWRMRRSRGAIFSSEIFGEPAWDMLLDLFQHQVAGRHVYIKSACIGADVPTTTGLRWIDSLIERKLIVRHADTKDRRRQTISLSSEGMSKMRLCLAQMWEQLAIPGR